MNPKPNYLSSFGRNRGRSLSTYQQGLVDGLLPKLAVDIAEIEKISAGGDAGAPLPSGEAGLLSMPKACFSNPGEGGATQVRSRPHPDSLSDAEDASLENPTSPEGRGGPASPSVHRYTRVALEIGFGGGEHLLAQAAHHPETLFIGCEPFINGVAKCLMGIEQRKLTNIRLFTDDARKLIEALPSQCLDSVFILFPDPWPKARHNKRRLVNVQTLGMLARVHKLGGRLLLATDHVDYSVWMLEVLQRSPDYHWTATQQADWKTPPKDWTETKYQRKTTAEGREPVFLECVRVSS